MTRSSLRALPDSFRADIQASWTRSRLNGLDEHGAPGLDIEAKGNETSLARAAHPVLRRTLSDIEGSSVAVVLVDQTARVVDVRGATREITRAIDTLGLAPGVQLSEERVGTNALGTPVEIRRSLLVRGADHYLAAFRGFTCYGHPIFHPLTRRLEGVLGIGGQFEADYRLSASLARRVVGDIEERLLEESPRAQTRLMSAFHAAVGRRSRPVVVIGDGLVLATPAALDILEPADHAAVRACTEAIRAGAAESHCLTLASGLDVTLTCEPIDGTDGVLVELAPDRAIRPLGATSDRTVRWPLLVIGESGTGRTTEAKTAAGPDPICLDATRVVLVGDKAWASRLEQALGGHGPAVIVENIQLLSEQLTALLAQRLRDTDRHVVLTSTPGDHLDEIHAALPALCNDRRELLPLRRRRHEIPALAQQLLAEVSGHTRTRFTAESLRVLAAQPWRGNIAELRRVVEHAAAARSAGDIIPTDLPISHRASPAPGSPFEEAEREVIVAAIEAAGGNKLQAARALGVSRSTLYNRIRALRIA